LESADLRSLRVLNSKYSSWSGALRPSAVACGCVVLLMLAYPPALARASFARQSTKQEAAKPENEKQPDLKGFAGTWNAKYKGEVFATLILKEERGALSGTLNNFDINVDKDGNLIDGTHKNDGDAPLLNVHFESGALTFTVLEKDQYRDGMTWKFVPLNSREGELTPVLEHQEDAPKDFVVKPIHMLREGPKP
jgi:hypothetical protein